MKCVRQSAPQLQGLEPYDPKYLPAQAFLSANENPSDVDDMLRSAIDDKLKEVAFNRYPDPLANKLRHLVAESYGLSFEQVLFGNGGDELLFNIALAWGGVGRTFLNVPPTFSVYENNARLTGTTTVTVPRRADFSLDGEAILARVAQKDIDYIIITSPNNPTGQLASQEFLLQLLDATDALVVVDEAYYEFAGVSMCSALVSHKNLVILRTFSKAYSLAGVRMGYLLGDADVIRELIKVRQPYSVDVVSQAIVEVVYEHRALFGERIQKIVSERVRMIEELSAVAGVIPYPTDANYVLFRMKDSATAARLWEALYAQGILIRDFSQAPLLEGCLRVSVGTPHENDCFLAALREFVSKEQRV